MKFGGVTMFPFLVQEKKLVIIILSKVETLI
jgi:hypothetical protein